MVGTALSTYLLQLYDMERQKRPSFNWTQWAQEADVPLTTLTRLKNGNTQDPQFGTICMVLRPVGGSIEDLQRIMNGLLGGSESPAIGPPAPSPAASVEHVEVIRAAQADTAQRYNEALVREGEERKRAYDNHIRAMEDQIGRLETHNIHLRTTLYITLGFLIAALIALVVLMVADQNAAEVTMTATSGTIHI